MDSKKPEVDNKNQTKLSKEDKEFTEYLEMFLKEKFGVTVSNFQKYIDQKGRLFKHNQL